MRTDEEASRSTRNPINDHCCGRLPATAAAPGLHPKNNPTPHPANNHAHDCLRSAQGCTKNLTLPPIPRTITPMIV